MDVNMNRGPSCEYDGIDEDDAFYAEIRRQILLLTAEDDEDHQETEIINSVSAGTSKPGSDRVVGDLSSSLRYGSYFSSWDSEKTNSVPPWLSNLWRNSNGTGVFIPHINKSQRHRRPGRTRKRKTYGPEGSK